MAEPEEDVEEEPFGGVDPELELHELTRGEKDKCLNQIQNGSYYNPVAPVGPMGDAYNIESLSQLLLLFF